MTALRLGFGFAFHGKQFIIICGYISNVVPALPDIAKAVSGAEQYDFILLLAHNPDVTMMQNYFTSFGSLQ